MLQITLQQISITLGISHVISPTFKTKMINIQDWEIMVGEVPQTILRFSMKVFTMRKCMFKLPHELYILLRGIYVDSNGRFLCLIWRNIDGPFAPCRWICLHLNKGKLLMNTLVNTSIGSWKWKYNFFANQICFALTKTNAIFFPTIKKCVFKGKNINPPRLLLIPPSQCKEFIKWHVHT